jgi:energy-coupling factor transporter ATP-binding protein EcfA2
MAPELLTSLEADELRELAAKIREYQQRKSLSDVVLCKRFPDLGHTKTWTKVRTADWNELSLYNQLDNYRLAWANIEALGDRESRDEVLYEGIWATVKLASAFGEVETETDVARCIFLLGPSGSGKSSAIRHLAGRRGSRILIIRSTVVWNDSPSAMLGAILGGLGIRDVPMSPMDRLQRVQEKLSESRRCVVVEDAHHLGPRLLNLVITLIDSTPGEWILSAIDKLWSKIETASYAECRQLTGNRLADRINITGAVRASDAEKLLTARVAWVEEKGLIRKAAEHIAAKSAGYGLLAFIRESIKRLNSKLAQHTPQKLCAWDDLVAAADEEARSR